MIKEKRVTMKQNLYFLMYLKMCHFVNSKKKKKLNILLQVIRYLYYFYFLWKVKA